MEGAWGRGRGPRASFTARCAAAWVDALLALAAGFVGFLLASLAYGGPVEVLGADRIASRKAELAGRAAESSDASTVCVLVWLGVALAVAFGHLVLSGRADGQTVGRRLAGLRLIGDAGQGASTGQALGRAAIGALASLPWGIGLLWPLVDGDRRSAGERASGTYLVPALRYPPAPGGPLGRLPEALGDAADPVPAPTPRRLLAFLVNAALVGLAVAVPVVLAPDLGTRGSDLTLGEEGGTTLAGLVLFLAAPALAAVSAALLAGRGQSPGKLLVGIRVVRADGAPASAARLVLVRWLLAWCLWIVPLLGLVDWLVGLGAGRRCLHDLLADTVVVDARPPAGPAGWPGATTAP